MKRDNTQRIKQDIAKANGDVIRNAAPAALAGGSSRPGKPTPQKDREPTKRYDDSDSTQRTGTGKQRNDNDNLETDVEGGDVERGTGSGQRRSTSIER